LIAGITALPLAAHARQAAPLTRRCLDRHFQVRAEFGRVPQRLDGPRWNGLTP
jgi:hypothetical protein